MSPALHDYLPVILLVLGLFAGIWLNRRDFSELKADTNRQIGDLKADMDRQFDTVNRRFDRIDSDLKEFYGAGKQLEGRVNELSARIK